jgi:hypothetical protein
MKPFCSQMFSKSSLHIINHMRTIGQHNSEEPMMTKVKKLFVRPAFPLLDDLAGVTVLFVLLFAGLTLSGTA